MSSRLHSSAYFQTYSFIVVYHTLPKHLNSLTTAQHLHASIWCSIQATDILVGSWNFHSSLSQCFSPQLWIFFKFPVIASTQRNVIRKQRTVYLTRKRNILSVSSRIWVFRLWIERIVLTACIECIVMYLGVLFVDWSYVHVVFVNPQRFDWS